MNNQFGGDFRSDRMIRKNQVTMPLNNYDSNVSLKTSNINCPETFQYFNDMMVLQSFL